MESTAWLGIFLLVYPSPKWLPVRYFTLARALSSASKYQTVIAYLKENLEQGKNDHTERKKGNAVAKV